MNDVSRAPMRWTLADLVDFETQLAAVSNMDSERQRFARDIRPQLGGGDPGVVRRRGLRLWLVSHRRDGVATAGDRWMRALAVVRLGVFVAMAAGGTSVAAGLCLGQAQAVHVVVFVALTLLLPWSLFVVLALAALAGRLSRRSLRRAIGLVLGVAERAGRAAAGPAPSVGAERLLDTPAARRAFAAELGGLLQWGGLGFQLGLLLAFLGILMVFDVRFYWEATPQSDALVRSATQVLATPWAWVWPAAVPGAHAIKASRARYIDGVRQVPGGAAAAWWRFLSMALVVWGALPRTALIGFYWLARQRALARLDFQAPRHRRLWRALAGVERASAARAVGDSALVLDVGGIGVDGQTLRGFLLRALRVNPSATGRVSVLDDAAEAAADAALDADPAHVVLLVADWALAPRQAAALHERVRAAVGVATPVTWVVLAVADGMPTSPDPAHLGRWTAFIDGLRDPATEITGYDPAA